MWVAALAMRQSGARIHSSVVQQRMPLCQCCLPSTWFSPTSCWSTSWLPCSGNHSSPHFSSGWCLCAWESPYVLHPASRKFPQCCISTSFGVGLTDDSLFWTSHGRSSDVSSFYAYCQMFPLFTPLTSRLSAVSNPLARLQFIHKRQINLSTFCWSFSDDWADRLAGKSAVMHGLHLRRSEVLRSLRH